MTKKEQTGKRPSALSPWFRKKMPDSKTGYWVHDIDWCIYNNKTKKLMLLEEKTYGAKVSWAQKETLKILNKALHMGLKELGVVYMGCNLITFRGAGFEDDVYFNNDIETEGGLIEKLTF